MNRKYILIFLAALLVFALVACGGAEPAVEEPAVEEPAAEEPAEPMEKTKVVIFIGMGTGTDPDQIAAQEALADEFNATNDDIEVEFLIVPH